MTRKVKTSKAADIERRKGRVRELFLLLRMRPKDIAERLLAEGVMRARSFDSAYRLVRADVEELRNDLTATQVLALGDPVERERFLSHMQFVMETAAREMAKAEATTETETTMQDGSTIVSTKTSDRGGVNQRWAQTYMNAAKEMALVLGGAAKPKDEFGDDEKPAREQIDPYQIIGCGLPADQLIETNIARGKVN